MNVRTQTVKEYVSTLFNKTGTGNRLALTLHLMDKGRALLQAGNAGGRPSMRTRAR